MRSYGQHCALAKALDLIGDRWTMLIVRELLIQGACRYTDLLEGLPGIATNLLASRLRELEQAGVLDRIMPPPPVATMLFRLTPRGEELEPILFQLGCWGAPLLAKEVKGDVFRTHWLLLPARHSLRDHCPQGPPVKIELRAGGQAISIETVNGAVVTRLGGVDRPDVLIQGPPRLIAALLLGKLDLRRARAAGLQLKGNPKTLRRVQPLA